MASRYLRLLLTFAFAACLPALAQDPVVPKQDPLQPRNGGDFSTNLNPTEKQKVPEGVIIVKGAWSSASDTVTPLPEDEKVANNTFTDEYFGMSYTLPEGWREKNTGPPPSETGMYMLSLITPGANYKGTHASIAVMAQDTFFSILPANNALELIKYKKDTLPDYYKMELQPTQTTIAGHPFTFFAYWSPVAELHWYVVATEIRCHSVQFVMTSRDTKLLENLILQMNNMKLPPDAGAAAGKGGGNVPACVKNYARDENIIEREDPVFTERRFNAVPVRIIIDKTGKIRHIHFLTAFPEQAKAITEALKKWRFRPYVQDGQAVEVETGIMFGRGPRLPNVQAKDALHPQD